MSGCVIKDSVSVRIKGLRLGFRLWLTFGVKIGIELRVRLEIESSTGLDVCDVDGEANVLHSSGAGAAAR